MIYRTSIPIFLCFWMCWSWTATANSLTLTVEIPRQSSKSGITEELFQKEHILIKDWMEKWNSKGLCIQRSTSEPIPGCVQLSQEAIETDKNKMDFHTLTFIGPEVQSPIFKEAYQELEQQYSEKGLIPTRNFIKDSDRELNRQPSAEILRLWLKQNYGTGFWARMFTGLATFFFFLEMGGKLFVIGELLVTENIRKKCNFMVDWLKKIPRGPITTRIFEWFIEVTPRVIAYQLSRNVNDMWFKWISK